MRFSATRRLRASRSVAWRAGWCGGITAAVMLAACLAVPVRGQSSKQNRSLFPGERGADEAFLTITFFPPTAPPYGAPIASAAAAHRGGRNSPAAPEELADFVNESFYPMLGTRLFGREVGRRMHARIDAFHQERARLVNELIDELVALHDAAPAARETALRALAARQASGIAALEAEAEGLRDELLRGGLLQPRTDWGAQRTWNLTETEFARDYIEKEAEFQVVRAAAFFQEGLSPAQRGLLRELAIELQERALQARSPQPRKAEESVLMFFSPETSRFKLPPDLPDALIEKIGRYNGLKAELKRELLETLRRHDSTSSGRRATAFHDLRSHQDRRLRELEDLAEVIRRTLAALPPPSPPALPPIPPMIQEQIAGYNRDRAGFLEELSHLLRAVGLENIDDLPPAEDLGRRKALTRQRRLEAQRQAAEKFLRDNRERYNELRERYELIIADLKTIAQDLTDSATGRPMTVEGLLKVYHIAMQRFEAFGREDTMYVNYRLAMLQPGLSPEQRRLLFGAALVGLAQPLPDGEPMPFGSRLRISP